MKKLLLCLAVVLLGCLPVEISANYVIRGQVNGANDWDNNRDSYTFSPKAGDGDIWQLGPVKIDGAFKVYDTVGNKWYGFDNVADDGSRTHVTSWDGDSKNIGYNGSAKSNMIITFNATSKSISIAPADFTGDVTIYVDITGKSNPKIYAWNPNDNNARLNNASYPGIAISNVGENGDLKVVNVSSNARAATQYVQLTYPAKYCMLILSDDTGSSMDMYAYNDLLYTTGLSTKLDAIVKADSKINLSAIGSGGSSSDENAKKYSYGSDDTDYGWNYSESHLFDYDSATETWSKTINAKATKYWSVRRVDGEQMSLDPVLKSGNNNAIKTNLTNLKIIKSSAASEWGATASVTIKFKENADGTLNVISISGFSDDKDPVWVLKRGTETWPLGENNKFGPIASVAATDVFTLYDSANDKKYGCNSTLNLNSSSHGIYDTTSTINVGAASTNAYFEFTDNFTKLKYTGDEVIEYVTIYVKGDQGLWIWNKSETQVITVSGHDWGSNKKCSDLVDKENIGDHLTVTSTTLGSDVYYVLTFPSSYNNILFNSKSNTGKEVKDQMVYTDNNGTIQAPTQTWAQVVAAYEAKVVDDWYIGGGTGIGWAEGNNPTLSVNDKFTDNNDGTYTLTKTINNGTEVVFYHYIDGERQGDRYHITNSATADFTNHEMLQKKDGQKPWKVPGSSAKTITFTISKNSSGDWQISAEGLTEAATAVKWAVGGDYENNGWKKFRDEDKYLFTPNSTNTVYTYKLYSFTKGKYMSFYLDNDNNQYNPKCDNDNNNWYIKDNSAGGKLHKSDKGMYFDTDMPENKYLEITITKNGDGWDFSYMYKTREDVEHDTRTVYFIFPDDYNCWNGKSVKCYAYLNETVVGQATPKNANWPGVDATYDKAMSDLVGKQVYKYEITNNDFDMLIFNNGESKGDNQTRNMAIVNNGVYSLETELLPENVVIFADSEDTKDKLVQYSETEDALDPTYIYIEANEFGENFGLNNTVYVNYYQKNEAGNYVQRTGLRGTSTMVPKRINGVDYYYFPAINMTPGAPFKVEFYVKDDGSDNKWKGGICNAGEGNHVHGVDGEYLHGYAEEELYGLHLNCTDATRIMTYPEGYVTYEDGQVYLRYSAKQSYERPEGTKDMYNIATVMPSELALILNGEEVATASADENGLYVFGKNNSGDDVYDANDTFYFKFKDIVEEGEGDDKTSVDNGYNLEPSKATSALALINYSVAQTEDATHVDGHVFTIAKQSVYDNGYYIVLNYRTQRAYTVPFAIAPFVGHDAAAHQNAAVYYTNGETSTIDFNNYEGDLLAVRHEFKETFYDGLKHFSKVKFNVTPSFNKVNTGYLDPQIASYENWQYEGDNAEQRTFATSYFACQTAGEYKVGLSRPACSEFEAFQHVETITVHPTIHSVGLTIHGFSVSTDDSGDKLPVLYVPEEIENAEKNFTLDNIDYSYNHCFLDVLNVPYEVGKNDLSRENVKIYFKYGRATSQASTSSDYAYAPRRVESKYANAASLSDYTMYDRNNSIDLVKAATAEVPYLTLVVSQNGIYSEPLEVNVVQSNGNIATAVEEIEAAADDTEAVYYDLQGFQVANPSNGIFIKVVGGKATKVVL